MRPDSTATEISRSDRGRAVWLWLVWAVWILLLIPPIVALFQPQIPLPDRVTGLAGLGIFAAIYLGAAWRNALLLVMPPAPVPAPQAGESRSLETWAPLAALAVLSVLFRWVGGPDLFIYTSAYAAGRLPTVRAIQVIVGLALLAIVTGLHGGASFYDVGQSVTFVGIVGAVVLIVVQGVGTSRELRVAREEIARLAVTAERLRIARDLHDLLGHNLSLIALKSELAGRLVPLAPERAVAEIADVEQVARTTLQQVREALAGYRQPTLVGELEAARQLLAAAGIAFQQEGAAGGGIALPAPVEAVLSWAVREGVTNVVRHSRAHECVIRLARDTGIASVEVTDDGDPRAARAVAGGGGRGAPGGEGSGLRGLADRAQALGGRFEAGPRPGGFRLALTIPLTPGAGAAGSAPAGADPQEAPVAAREYGSRYRERSAEG